MICKVLLAVFCCCCLFKVQRAERSPRIIIVGGGAAGIAAASRLLEYGFDNVTILEAENRIGGRVFTKEWGDYWVDLGGQWVHGEVDNAAYELAWPLGLLEHSATSYPAKFYSSSGPTITEDTGNKLVEYFLNVTLDGVPDDWENRSIGEFYEQKLDEWFDVHPEIPEDLRKGLKRMFDMMEMSDLAGNSWYDVTADNVVIGSEGDQALNWKDRGYSTILDILMKKYPNPSEELPVLNNTILNAEVSQIHYDVENGSIRVITSNGNQYPADHVIVTTSVGVLKAEYRTMFSPPLPKAKVNAIEGIELGHVAKIFLLYSEPWWIEPNSDVSPNYFFNFHWTDEDRYEYASDPNKAWMLSIVTATIVEHKSRLLCCWLTGPYARQMETFSANRVFEQVKQFFHRFLGRTHNISEPVAMLRSTWYINKHFRGTWSYHSLRTARSGAKAIDLERPILTTNGEPLVQFAGEATHSTQPSTVHGAIDSGWREARRLTQLYAGRRFLPTHVGINFWATFDGSNDPVLNNRLVTGSWNGVVAKRRKSNKN